jgi:hypothetical protein
MALYVRSQGIGGVVIELLLSKCQLSSADAKSGLVFG